MNKNQVEVIGEKIREIRLSLGKSMTEFGKMIDDYDINGKTKSGTVSNWETGKNLPNNERLKKIAELGNVSVPYIMGVDDANKDMISIPVSEYERLKQAEEQLNNIKEILGGKV